MGRVFPVPTIFSARPAADGEKRLIRDGHGYSHQRTQAWLGFVAKVSKESFQVTTKDIAALRGDGWGDLQIAETIHLTALFAAFNRVANGFGLPSQGVIGTLDPSNVEGRTG